MQDGLAYKKAEGTWGGPIGENIARALEHGCTSSAEPYHGYFFKILKRPGPAAPKEPNRSCMQEESRRKLKVVSVLVIYSVPESLLVACCVQDGSIVVVHGAASAPVLARSAEPIDRP